jgi:hypothetical protein
MPEKTIKHRLTETRDAELADYDGPIFSTVANLVDNLSDRRELLAQFTMLLLARIIDIPSPF